MRSQGLCWSKNQDLRPETQGATLNSNRPESSRTEATKGYQGVELSERINLIHSSHLKEGALIQ